MYRLPLIDVSIEQGEVGGGSRSKISLVRTVNCYGTIQSISQETEVHERAYALSFFMET